MDIPFLLNKFLALLTIAADLFVVLSIIYLLFFRKKYRFVFFEKNGIVFAFVVALTASLASLFYSQVLNFPPCDLCWFQRVFMIPEAVLLGLALIKKDSNIVDYSLVLAFFGFFISLYQNYIDYLNSSSSFCQAGVSCLNVYILEFGYVTIPAMSLTSFALIIIFMFFQKLSYNKGIKN